MPHTEAAGGVPWCASLTEAHHGSVSRLPRDLTIASMLTGSRFVATPLERTIPAGGLGQGLGGRVSP